jgi:hypothetical protein
MKKSDTIGNRSRDLPVCSAAPPRAPTQLQLVDIIMNTKGNTATITQERGWLERTIHEADRKKKDRLRISNDTRGTSKNGRVKSRRKWR